MNNITIILLAIIILMMPLIACVPNNNADEIQTGARMVIIERTITYDIAYDRYTKVMYAISHGEHNCGNFTPLVDSDGNPLLYGN